MCEMYSGNRRNCGVGGRDGVMNREGMEYVEDVDRWNVEQWLEHDTW